MNHLAKNCGSSSSCAFSARLLQHPCKNFESRDDTMDKVNIHLQERAIHELDP